MLITLVAIIILFMIIAFILGHFWSIFTVLAINIPIIYVVCVHGYIEVIKEKKWRYYLIGLAVAFLLTLPMKYKGHGAIWFASIFLLITLAVAKLAMFIHEQVDFPALKDKIFAKRGNVQPKYFKGVSKVKMAKKKQKIDFNF